jgi:two-component system sensor kinase
MRNSFKSLWASYAGMNHAERLPPSPALSLTYASYGFLLSSFGRFSRASNYLDRSIQLRRELNDLWGIAQGLFAQGVALYAAARFEESFAKLNESLDLYGKTGGRWETNANRLHCDLCNIKLGNSAAAIESSRAIFARDVRLGDDNSGYYGLSGWSIASRGNLPFEELKTYFRPLPENVIATSMLLMGEGYWHWFHSRTESALQAFDSAYQYARKSFAINHMTVATLPCLVTALRRHSEALDGEDDKQARRIRRRALRLAKWATRLTRFFPAHYSHSLRELSFAYVAKGRLKKALRLAEKSCAVAEGQKAKYEYAESLLLRGQLTQQLGLPGAEDEIRTAEVALAERDRLIQAATRNPAPGQFLG